MYKWQEQTSWFGEEQIICISGKNKLHGLVMNNSYIYKWQEQTSWFDEEQIIYIRGKNKLHGLMRNKSYIYVARTNFMVW